VPTLLVAIRGRNYRLSGDAHRATVPAPQPS
jgi:hypothetical protein